jgi:hypothetical protein
MAAIANGDRNGCRVNAWGGETGVATNFSHPPSGTIKNAEFREFGAAKFPGKRRRRHRQKSSHAAPILVLQSKCVVCHELSVEWHGQFAQSAFIRRSPAAAPSAIGSAQFCRSAGWLPGIGRRARFLRG